jgi:hypothetical protein
MTNKTESDSILKLCNSINESKTRVLKSINIDQLEQLEKAATPKPWVAVKNSLVLHKNGRIDAYGIVRPIPEGDCLFEDGNAEFIAAARNAMPDLINEVRVLRARIEWLAHLDTEEGRRLHATEVVRLENEELKAEVDRLRRALVAMVEP